MMTPKKALVVDDSRSARYSLRKTLERMDMSVDCVESGENALSYLEAAQAAAGELPDIIFMDNLMPGLSGLDTTETIHQDARWRHIPVVMCTATQHPDQANQQTAAAGFLPKPATTNQIQALLATLSPSPAADTPATGEAPTPQPSATQTAHAADTAQPEPQPSLIQGRPAAPNDSAVDLTPTPLPTIAQAASTPTEAPPATEPQSPQAAATTTPSIDGSLDALIDQLQGQLNGIEPRLLSLESAKHTLDTAIHQRLKEMHDQLVAHVHQLIDEAIQKHERPDLDTEAIKKQVKAVLDETVTEKLSPLEQQLREELDAQSRHIEHRLMGEVMETDHIIEQACAAATQTATTRVNELMATHTQAETQRQQTLLSDAEQALLQRAESAAKRAAMEQATTAAAQEAEKIACQQAEKAVSDNLQRLQRQLAESAQSQINDAIKRQQIMGIAGFGVAIIALVLSVVL